jgi:iron(III) transport system substrate-binding protein
MKSKTAILILAVLVVWGGTAYAQQKQATLAEIVKAAEKEGQVRWTSTFKDDEIIPLIKAFNKDYPNIKVFHEREHGVESQERMIRELVSGATMNDVVQIGFDYERELIQMDALERVNWVDLKVLPQLVSNENRMVAIAGFPFSFGFNTKLLKKEEAPKTWEDLLDPKWKGKIVVDTRPQCFVNLAGAWGTQKVLEYVKKLGQNSPIFVRGQTELASMMAAGQYMLSASSYLQALVYVAQKGAPIAWSFPNPVPIDMVDQAVLKKAKHPNAGKVLLAWLGSKGYKIWDEINWGRGLPYGGTLLEKALQGKSLSFPPSREQMPDRQQFEREFIKTIGVKK